VAVIYNIKSLLLAHFRFMSPVSGLRHRRYVFFSLGLSVSRNPSAGLLKNFRRHDRLYFGDDLNVDMFSFSITVRRCPTYRRGMEQNIRNPAITMHVCSWKSYSKKNKWGITA